MQAAGSGTQGEIRENERDNTCIHLHFYAHTHTLTLTLTLTRSLIHPHDHLLISRFPRTQFLALAALYDTALEVPLSSGILKCVMGKPLCLGENLERAVHACLGARE